MDESKIAGLRQKLASLKGQVAELKEQAGEFPAIGRNSERMEASLAMMAVALGVSVLEQADTDPAAGANAEGAGGKA